MKIVTHPSGTSSRFFRNLTYHNIRKLIWGETAAAPLVGVVVSGAILAGFLKHLGISDNVTAVLMQLLVFASSAQSFAPLLYMNTRRRITIARNLYACWRVLCIVVVLSVFVPQPGLRAVVFAVIYSVAFICAYLADPAYMEYLSNIVPPRMRGRFLGKRDALAIATTAIFSMALSFILDRFQAAGKGTAGFLTLYAIAAIGVVLQLSCYYRMKELPVRKPKPSTKPPVVRLAEPLRDHSFRKIILYNILYNIGVYVANSYVSIYLVSELRLDYAYIAVMSVVSTIARIIAGPRWGRFGDRFGYVRLSVLSIALLAISLLMNGFVTPVTYPVLLPLLNIVSGVAWGGLAVGNLNTYMLNAKRESMTVYLGVNGGLASLAGFLAALLGAMLADRMTGLHFQLLGLPITYMQVMFFLSAALLVAAGLFAIFCVKDKSRAS